MAALNCFKILFKEPDILLDTVNELTMRMAFYWITQKALSSSPLQTTFEALELEV